MDPEVLQKAKRRQFTAEYKLRILAEVERATQPGEIGHILRREGLYSSHLITWRRQHHEGALSALEPKKRGRKAKEVNPLASKLAEAEAKNRKLEKRLREAQIIIEFQKKVADVLGIPLSHSENEERDRWDTPWSSARRSARSGRAQLSTSHGHRFTVG